MRYSKYVGDINIELEGKPDEIIEVLKYLDGTDKDTGYVVKVGDKEIIKADVDGNLTVKGGYVNDKSSGAMMSD